MASSDQGWICDQRNKKEVSDFFYSSVPTTQEMQKSWFEATLKKNEYNFVIWSRECDERIGTVALYDIDWVSRKCEFGRFFISNEYRGRGLSTEVMFLIFGFVFNDLNMNKIHLGVFVNNEQAVSFYRKVGFEVEGTLSEHVWKNGVYRSIHLMSFLRSMYLSI